MQIFKICYPLFLTIAITSSNLIDLLEKKSKSGRDLFQKSSIDCITAITNKYIPCGTLITLLYTTSYVDALGKLLASKNCYAFITRSFETQRWLLWSEFYITLMRNYTQFSSHFNELSRDVAWNPKAKFIIVIYNLNETEYKETFTVLMKLNIFNVHLLTKSTTDSINVYTYNPFDKGACGQSFDDLIKIKSCEDLKAETTDYNQLENKYRNCTITLAGVEDVPNFIFKTNKEFSYLGINTHGLEQYMLANIAKQENITLEYILVQPGANHGVVLPNGTVTGILRYLQNNSASIIVGGFLLMKNRMDMFETIWGYNYANFYLFTPAHGEQNWKKVYQQFSTSTWALIVLSYLFVTLVIIVIHRQSLDKKDNQGIAFKLFGNLLGNISKDLFQIKKIRIFMIIWIWFTFFIASFYSTAFYSLITGKDKKDLVFTDKSLNVLPFEPCISDNVRIFFKYTFNDKLPGKLSKMCRTDSAALDTVANTHKHYTLLLDYSYNMREFKYIDGGGHHKLDKYHYLSDMTFTMYTTRGFPLKEKFHRYAYYHIETGLIQRHRDIIYHRYKIFNRYHSHSFHAFHLPDFRIHYGILVLGYIISLICFIIEINTTI